jgi:hypothetical protein
VAESYRKLLYDALGKTESDVFPLRVVAVPGLALGVSEALVPGWMGV